QLPISEGSDGLGDRAVIDQRRAVAATGGDMAVERVPAQVELRSREPAGERLTAVVEHPLPGPLPVDRRGGLGPERLRFAERAAVGLDIARHPALLSASASIVGPGPALAKRLDTPPCGEENAFSGSPGEKRHATGGDLPLRSVEGDRQRRA